MWLYLPKRLKLNGPKRNRAVLTGIKRELCRSIETGKRWGHLSHGVAI